MKGNVKKVLFMIVLPPGSVLVLQHTAAYDWML